MLTNRIPHGSPAGYEAGCRTRSSCPHGDLSPWVTCAEASVRRRSDYRMWQLPLDQPIPRSGTVDDAPRAPQAQEASGADTDLDAHGTLGGYRRGCHRDRLCPNWTIGRTTCAGARREYIRDYRERRFRSEGHSITHGTPYGYYLGCRDRRTCPGSADGVTCSDAQARDRSGRRHPSPRGAGRFSRGLRAHLAAPRRRILAARDRPPHRLRPHDDRRTGEDGIRTAFAHHSGDPAARTRVHRRPLIRT